jgi:hypothetical protein
LVFETINESSLWGIKDAFISTTKILEHLIVASLFIAKVVIAFKRSTEITLANEDKEALIYYRLGYKGGFNKYVAPLIIDSFINLTVYAQKVEIKSKTITIDCYKIDLTIIIDLQTKYANQYNAVGDKGLIDGIIRVDDFRTCLWQGYFDTD